MMIYSPGITISTPIPRAQRLPHSSRSQRFDSLHSLSFSLYICSPRELLVGVEKLLIMPGGFIFILLPGTPYFVQEFVEDMEERIFPPVIPLSILRVIAGKSSTLYMIKI